MSEAATRPRVLWVGRMLFSPEIRVREVELARCFAEFADVFALDRSDALPRGPQGLSGKIAMRLKLWNAKLAVLEEGTLTRFRMRVAGATGPFFNRVAADYNEVTLSSALIRFRCTHVFLSSPIYFLPPPLAQREYRVHFDLVDNFYDEWPNTRVGRARKRFLREAMSNADTLSACSRSLCDVVERVTGRKAAYAPNGAPVERFARFTADDGAALRKRLGLDGRFVIGFIGNHNMPFDGMQTLVAAFAKARETRPELALLIVGPGSDKAGAGREQGVWAIGPVPPDDVPPYFLACDAGVHPYTPQPLTHDATPLNVVEFGLCGKPMLCNPLRELQRLKWPNIRFTRDASIEAWAEALADPASFADFDRQALAGMIKPFDWKLSADVIRREMEL